MNRSFALGLAGTFSWKKQQQQDYYMKKLKESDTAYSR